MTFCCKLCSSNPRVSSLSLKEKELAESRLPCWLSWLFASLTSDQPECLAMRNVLQITKSHEVHFQKPAELGKATEAMLVGWGTRSPILLFIYVSLFDNISVADLQSHAGSLGRESSTWCFFSLTVLEKKFTTKQIPCSHLLTARQSPV